MLLLITGIGFIFSRTDEAARAKDQRRFGPLSNLGLGGWYQLAEQKWTRMLFILFCVSVGLFLIGYAIL